MCTIGIFIDFVGPWAVAVWWFDGDSFGSGESMLLSFHEFFESSRGRKGHICV